MIVRQNQKATDKKGITERKEMTVVIIILLVAVQFAVLILAALCGDGEIDSADEYRTGLIDKYSTKQHKRKEKPRKISSKKTRRRKIRQNRTKPVKVKKRFRRKKEVPVFRNSSYRP